MSGIYEDVNRMPRRDGTGPIGLVSLFKVCIWKREKASTIITQWKDTVNRRKRISPLR